MASVTFDAFSSGLDDTPSGDITVSHTNAGNILVVQVGILQNAGSGSIDNVVYAGSPLTQLNVASANDVYLWTGYILAPSVGTFNIVATFAGTPVEVVATGFSAIGCNVIAPFNGSTYSETGTATGDTFSNTTTRDGCLILGMSYKKTNDGLSSSGWTADNGTGVISTTEYKSARLTAATGANTPSFSWTNSRDYASTSVAIAPKVTGIVLGF